MKVKDKLLGLWNIWPPFLGAGIRIKKVSPDYRYMRVEMPLRFWNSNYVGTQYGGSMFSMTDPFYMVMLLRNLGKAYIVWDKAASIRYVAPGKTRVHAEFTLTEELLQEIRKTVDEKGKVDWPFKVIIKDENQETVAEVDKIVYIKKK
ncbi:hypothetical protein D3C87_301420 [compost metagenome]